jgi:hypothetical protein
MSEEDNGSEDWIDEAVSGKDERSSIDELKGAMPQGANIKAPQDKKSAVDRFFIVTYTITPI